MKFLYVCSESHRAHAVHYATDLQTKRDKKQMRTLWSHGLDLSLETNLLGPSSFANEPYGQVEDISIEVIRKLFSAIQRKKS